MNNQILEILSNNGYCIYSILCGKMEPNAKFAIADPNDDKEGFYLECSTLIELAEEAQIYFGFNTN